MPLVKDVEEYMINIVLLGLLAVIDFIKKEIHIFVLLPVTAIWVVPVILGGGIEIKKIAAAVLLIGFSIVTKQAFGMADAIVLSLIALENGIMYMLLIFFTANLVFLLFAAIRFGFRQKKREIPFIPFIFIVFVFSKIILPEVI